jgi:hypothetical protein
MPKSKLNPAIRIDEKSLVDAVVMATLLGFSPQYVGRLADRGAIPWHGVCNGVRTYRRYNPEEVMAALRHKETAEKISAA